MSDKSFFWPESSPIIKAARAKLPEEVKAKRNFKFYIVDAHRSKNYDVKVKGAEFFPNKRTNGLTGKPIPGTYISIFLFQNEIEPYKIE